MGIYVTVRFEARFNLLSGSPLALHLRRLEESNMATVCFVVQDSPAKCTTDCNTSTVILCLLSVW